MKYDDASWHYGGDFPDHLPPEAGGTHIGMFVCWALLNGLAGDIHIEDFPEGLSALQARSLSPGGWFMAHCDEKFTDEDLNPVGNAFAAWYYPYDTARVEAGEPSYLADYEALFCQVDDLYAVADTWQNFERLKPLLDHRFQHWQASNKSGGLSQ